MVTSEQVPFRKVCSVDFKIYTSLSIFLYFRNTHWNYCVLDEGHIIKNSKTKVSFSDIFVLKWPLKSEHLFYIKHHFN